MEINQQSNTRIPPHRATPRQRLHAALVFAIISALFAAVGLAENLGFNVGRLFSPCGFKQRFNLPCITCGMTTSVRAFVRGQLLQSFYIQPAAALLCCITLIVALYALYIALTGRGLELAKRIKAQLKFRYIIIALIIILLSAWAVTLSQALSS